MKRTLALGGIAAGLLASAAIAAPANADTPKDVASTTLASTNFAAKQVVQYWIGEHNANLIGATPYAAETKVITSKVQAKVPSVPASTKPGVVGSSGDSKPAAGKLKNINLPRTVGKVFFVGADGKNHWCSATSVQNQYKNLVATAGHCVYDTVANKGTLDNWVFIPGYYEGKAPWGIYVGKTAYTHYDFSVFEDGDSDYAFVTVYNGVEVTGVTGDKVKNWVKDRYFDTKADAEKAKKDLETKDTGWSGEIVAFGPNDVKNPWSERWNWELAKHGQESQKVYVPIDDWCTWTKLAPAQIGALVRGGQADASWRGKAGYEVTRISKEEFKTATGSYEGDHIKDGVFYYAENNGWYKAKFWVNVAKKYKLTGHIVDVTLKDVGTLGGNVGGQGLAYNQKFGAQPVFIFGYPSGSQPDGNYAFTGKTMKWAYGKPGAYADSSRKAEYLQGVKTSFTGEGALGSSWLLKYSNTKRLGYLNGVTIGVADTDGNSRYDLSVSPYFNGETYAVYQSAASQWSGKIV